jgi:shikimate kinase
VSAIGSALPSAAESIFLWGAPGVGKTTVGRRLARTLGRPFFDTDALVVERAGMSIPSIFAQLGEPAFRALESEVLADAAANPGRVISLGGGTVLAPQNRALIAQCGRSIHLRATIATIERRVSRQRLQRPLLAAGIPVSTLVAQRLPLYESADHSIDVDRRRLDDIVAEICRLL